MRRGTASRGLSGLRICGPRGTRPRPRLLFVTRSMRVRRATVALRRGQGARSRSTVGSDVHRRPSTSRVWSRSSSRTRSIALARHMGLGRSRRNRERERSLRRAAGCCVLNSGFPSWNPEEKRDQRWSPHATSLPRASAARLDSWRSWTHALIALELRPQDSGHRGRPCTLDPRSSPWNIGGAARVKVFRRPSPDDSLPLHVNCGFGS